MITALLITFITLIFQSFLLSFLTVLTVKILLSRQSTYVLTFSMNLSTYWVTDYIYLMRLELYASQRKLLHSFFIYT